MLLNRASITIPLFLATFLSSIFSYAQGKRDSRTRPAIPYNHKVIAPPGMVYVKGGVTTINYDQSTTDTNSARKVSVTSFFMDKTEVTNQQYREFVNWVIDSIAIYYLKDEKYFLDDKGMSVPSADNGTASSTTTITPAVIDTTPHPIMDTTALSGGPKPIDNSAGMAPGATAPVATISDSAMRKRRIDWSKVDHDKFWNDADHKTKLASFLDDNGNIKKELYIYSYKHPKVNNIAGKVSKPVMTTYTLNVYPNENCWAEDLTNAQTDLYVENYFKVTPFDDYPVVGVSWLQANAFCNWRSNTARAYYNMPDYMKYYHLIYTLPSEAQWVYAAQGFYDMIYAPKYTNRDTLDTVNLVELPVDSMVVPHDSAFFAKLQHTQMDSTKSAIKAERIAEYDKKIKKAENGNMYMMDYIKMLNFLQNGYAENNNGPVIDSTPIHRDPNGMLTNFKQEEGDYWEDGAALTVPVMSFAPNEFGLYNMEGNVSEWMMDAYSPSAFSFVSDLNPQLIYDADSTDADVMKRKVVRGGSFISNAKSLSPWYRDMELQQFSHCFLGFRCVVEAPEVITKQTATRNRTQRGKRTPGKLSGVRLPEIH